MTMSQYLGRGSVSRGRMTITPALDTVVTTPPYLHDDFDKQAVIQGIKNLQAALSGIKNLTWIVPSPNQTVEDFVNTVSSHMVHPCGRLRINESTDGHVPSDPPIQPLDGYRQARLR